MKEVLYFSAPWCTPCQKFGPLVERVAKDYPHINVRKLNIDAKEGLEEGIKHNIYSIPTLVVPNVVTMQGATDEDTLRQWLDRV